MVAVANVHTVAQVPSQTGYFAYIPKGPVLDWSQPLLGDALFSQLKTLLRTQNVLTLRMELSQVARTASSERIAEQVAALGFRPAPTIQPIRSILLDLTADEETLLARMKEKWRYNVRLAGRRGVTVRMAETEEDVLRWYQLLQTTSERNQFDIHTLNYYLQAWHIFVPRNQACLLLAEYDGSGERMLSETQWSGGHSEGSGRQLLAGIFVGLLGKQAIYLYGASDNQWRQHMPNYLLQWEAMRWAKQQGATQYDL